MAIPFSFVSALEPFTDHDANSPRRLETTRPRTPSPYGTAPCPCRRVPSIFTLPATGLIQRRTTACSRSSPGSPPVGVKKLFPKRGEGNDAPPCQRSVVKVGKALNETVR